VEAIAEFFSEATAERLLAPRYDCVVDAIDVLGNKARLIRYDRNSGRQSEFQLRLSSLLKNGDSSANVKLQPGDVIIIPESMF
jgi:hypothetical protein